MNNHDSRVTPKVTVDIVITHLPTGRIILVERKNEPFGWALPGGFVDIGETTMHAAIREAAEEVQVNLSNVKQFHTYSEPGRDPRGHGITVVYTAVTMEKPEAADDAKSIGWFSPTTYSILRDKHVASVTDLTSSMALCFDHAQIIMDILQFNETGERPTRE